MKYSKTGFRPLYHNFCIFPLSESLKPIAEKLPGFDEAEGVLTYGYCDREAGFTLEILCCSKKINDEHFAFAETPDDTRRIVRIGAVSDEEYEFMGHGDGPIKAKFERKIEMLSFYDAEEEIETSPKFDFLDEFRHEVYPDDVLVFIVKEGLTPEKCWVRICGLGAKHIIGTLLNEPNQSFGYHAGDRIAFFPYEDSERKRYLISDFVETVKMR